MRFFKVVSKTERYGPEAQILEKLINFMEEKRIRKEIERIRTFSPRLAEAMQQLLERVRSSEE